MVQGKVIIDFRFAGLRRPVRIEIGDHAADAWTGYVDTTNNLRLERQGGDGVIEGEREAGLASTLLTMRGSWEIRVNQQVVAKLRGTWSRRSIQIGEHEIEMKTNRDGMLHSQQDEHFAIAYHRDDGRDHCMAIEAPDVNSLLALGCIVALYKAEANEI